MILLPARVRGGELPRKHEAGTASGAVLLLRQRRLDTYATVPCRRHDDPSMFPLGLSGLRAACAPRLCQTALLADDCNSVLTFFFFLIKCTASAFPARSVRKYEFWGLQGDLLCFLEHFDVNILHLKLNLIAHLHGIKGSQAWNAKLQACLCVQRCSDLSAAVVITGHSERAPGTGCAAQHGDR